MTRIRPLAVAALASLTFAACSKHSSTPETENAASLAAAPPEPLVAVPEPGPPSAPFAETQPAEPVVEAPPAREPLTDPQIAKILDAVDTGEIEQAKLAQTKSKNTRVKKYAQHMIQQHTKAKQKGAALTKKAKITPEDSDLSAQLTGKSSAQLDALKLADDVSFDALYIEGQSSLHNEVLGLLNEQLLPAASNDALKTHLNETRSMVESHLADADSVQQALGLAPSGAGAAGPATPTSGTSTGTSEAEGPATPTSGPTH